jgi:hypothetical protein
VLHGAHLRETPVPHQGLVALRGGAPPVPPRQRGAEVVLVEVEGLVEGVEVILEEAEVVEEVNILM